MPELIFCSVVKGRTSELIKNVRNHAPHVDRSIIVSHRPCPANTAFLSSEECKNLNVSWIPLDIPYNPKAMRDAYLSQLPVGSWCLHMDCDEFLEDPGCYQLRSLIYSAEREGYNRIAFNAHDVRIGLNGEVWDNQTSYWNAVLFKIYPGTCWAGETHGGLFMPGIPPVIANTKYRYFHIKTTASEFLRGCQNYWTTGESAQNNTSVPEWIEFKNICARYNLNHFEEMYKLMLAGNIPEDFKEWFLAQRDNINPEARSWFVVYFGLMHPEENLYSVGNRDISYAKNRKPYAGEMTF